MEERDLNRWEEFKEQVTEMRGERPGSGEAESSDLLFRGQEKSCWLLRSTLDRTQEGMRVEDYYQVICRIRPHIESLTGARWRIPEYPKLRSQLQEYETFSYALSVGSWPGYAYMAYLRHHGFPSPLLDWTRSPHVAAYFAFSKADGRPDSRVAIYALSRCRFTVRGNQMSNVFYPGPFVTTDKRHVLQQSQYTMCVNYENEWRFELYDAVFEVGHRQQGICCKFTIPATERLKVLRELDEYNLNAFSLFGSEDALMETLALREFSLRQESRSTHG